MTPQQHKRRRDEVATHVYGLVQVRAKVKGCRVKKIEDTHTRNGVLNDATFRLLTQIDYFFPKALRDRLDLQTFGNITVPRNIDPMLWLAWVLVHRYYIELGTFWYEESEARDKLIDRAIDAERKAHLRATNASGGTPTDNTDAMNRLARCSYGCTEFKLGQAPGVIVPANSVLDEIEREEDAQDFEAEEAAAYDARPQIEASENEKLRLARNAYGETLTNIRHRRALYLICSDPKASNSTIAARVSMHSIKGIKPNTVRQIRDKLTELANEILTPSPEELYMEELERLADKVEILQKEMDVLKAERRRASWLRLMSPEEFEAFRTSTFLADFAGVFETTPDRLLGVTSDAVLSTTIRGSMPKED